MIEIKIQIEELPCHVGVSIKIDALGTVYEVERAKEIVDAVKSVAMGANAEVLCDVTRITTMGKG
jgi:hypothetical protein